MDQKLVWYTVRASGLVAWALVVASVLWGLALSARATRRPRPAWVLDLHRFLGGLAFVFVALHLVGLLLDTYVGFGVRELFLAGASHWRPAAVAWGITALYLLVAIEITSLVMARISRSLWHAVHVSSFAVFVLVTVHALAAGTDAHEAWMRWFALGSCGAAIGLVMLRIAGPRPGSGRPDPTRRSLVLK